MIREGWLAPARHGSNTTNKKTWNELNHPNGGKRHPFFPHYLQTSKVWCGVQVDPGSCSCGWGWNTVAMDYSVDTELSSRTSIIRWISHASFQRRFKFKALIAVCTPPLISGRISPTTLHLSGNIIPCGVTPARRKKLELVRTSDFLPNPPPCPTCCSKLGSML